MYYDSESIFSEFVLSACLQASELLSYWFALYMMLFALYYEPRFPRAWFTNFATFECLLRRFFLERFSKAYNFNRTAKNVHLLLLFIFAWIRFDVFLFLLDCKHWGIYRRQDYVMWAEATRLSFLQVETNILGYFHVLERGPIGGASWTTPPSGLRFLCSCLYILLKATIGYPWF